MFGQIETGVCVYHCDEDIDTYADNETRTCVKTCPAGTYADNLTDRCVNLCPVSEKYYGDPSTHTCV